jgi:hypothetical protein
MSKTILQKLTKYVFKPKLQKSENTIGYKLYFRNIPERFVNGLVEWDLTETFKKFGLNVEEGLDYWTLGHIVNGISSRFDRNMSEYQSWLGGYIIKLPFKQSWTVEDHFKLAIADQNNWLHTYGDVSPMTTIEGYKFKKLGAITSGQNSGILYQGECVTHSDVGRGKKSIKFDFETDVMADLFNLSNPELKIEGKMLRSQASDQSYEILKLRGYIAIFNVEENIKVVLYGNGAIVSQKDGDIDTFEIIKGDILKAMQSCEIVKI